MRRAFGAGARAYLLLGVLLAAACGQEQAGTPSPAAPATGRAPGSAATGVAPAAGRASEPAAAAPRPPAPAPPPSATGDPEKGRQVYLAQCTACHHPDPAKDGTMGPAVKGSSPALLEARVLRAAYPPGYRPKRDSKVMPPRPDLARSVPDLAAFLR
jgi:mono/diheme cytochrome c family protein